MSNATRSLFMLFIFILICFSAAGIGSIFTSPAIGDWYKILKKPSLNPPNWIFGPVWSILYLTMAIAAWLIWKEGGFTRHSREFVIFGIQLLLNIAWSVIFFKYRMPGYAFLELILLWFAILIQTY